MIVYIRHLSECLFFSKVLRSLKRLIQRPVLFSKIVLKKKVYNKMLRDCTIHINELIFL